MNMGNDFVRPDGDAWVDSPEEEKSPATSTKKKDLRKQYSFSYNAFYGMAIIFIYSLVTIAVLASHIIGKSFYTGAIDLDLIFLASVILGASWIGMFLLYRMDRWFYTNLENR